MTHTVGYYHCLFMSIILFQIIVMNEGEITFQGSFDEVARSNPGLYRRWQQDVIAVTDSEVSDGLSADDSTLGDNRNTLKRQLSESLLNSASAGKF